MAQRFQVNGHLVSVEATGHGNINETFLAIFRTVFSEERVILQRISRNVFKNPEAVMSNMRFVTDFVHQRLEQEQSSADRIWQLPRLIPAKDGRDFAIDSEGNYWRAITVIASATAYDSIQSPEHAYEVGAVLGQFHRILSEMPVDHLVDTLPGFHITPGYMKQLDAALDTEEGKRRLNSSVVAREALKFIEERRDFTNVLEDARRRRELRLQPIHGDPKTSNVMIDDATGKGTSLIDLDTVKPGLIQYDIGDCLRSCCNPAGEETRELSNVIFDSDLCEAVMRGYKAHAGSFLTDGDRYHLYNAVRLITLELGIRFFADYLAGDVYFRVTREGQNLHRARVQFKLCQSIESREGQIRRLAESM